MIPQMAATLGYSVPTVAKYVGELMNEGYFIECGKMDSHRGRKPIIYGVNPSACYFVGVDIARFALNIGLMIVNGMIRIYLLQARNESIKTLTTIDALVSFPL
jgi:hypothetical protein